MQKINLIADSNFLEPLTLKEKDVQNYVLEHWEIIFPHLQLIKDEFQLEAGTRPNDAAGRVDILAFNPIKNCLVIIELKRYFDKNILHQLVDYQQSIEHDFNMIYIKISQDLKFPLPLMREMTKNADLVVMQKDFSVAQLRSISNQQITLLRYELWKNAENICFVFEYLNNEPKFKQNALAKKAQELPKKPDLFAPPPVLVQNKIIAKPAEIVKTDTDQAWWDSLTDAWKIVIKGNLLFKKYGVEEEVFWNNEYSNFYFSTILNRHLKKWGIIDFSLDLDFDLKEIYDLEMLYAKKYGIADIEPIKRLSKLKKANFSANSITNLSLFKDLKNLVKLDLGDNNISDLSSLGNLHNLVELDLGGNHISDLSSLGNLYNLVELDLSGNNIESLESLKNLINLKNLSLDYNQITNLKGLEKMVNLEKLSVTGNEVLNFNLLVNLPSLSYLGFTAKKFMNLTSLLSLISLKKVSIWEYKKLKDTQNVLADLKEKGVEIGEW